MVLRLADFLNKTENYTEALRALFIEASRIANVLIEIDEGEYLIDTVKPIPLCSDITVKAYGARFVFPEN